MVVIWLVALVALLSVTAGRSHADATSKSQSTLAVDHEDTRRRYDYRQSMKKPFFFHNDPSIIPYYEVRGNAIPSKDNIRLTAGVPDQKGSLWVSSSNPHPEWQLHFAFNVFGKTYIGGDGLALWYTQDKSVAGNVYGSKDKWKGLAIIFDTADTESSRFSPYIYGMMNDGSMVFEGNKDAMAKSIGGCFRDYRNAPHPIWGRLTYANRTLRLDMDLRQDGYAFTFCFEASNIDLPRGYHFGFSASTSEHHSDDHDIHALEVFEVNPKKGRGHDKELDEETKKRIDEIERIVKNEEQRERAQDSQTPDVFNPQFLVQLQENQFKVIEALNLLQDKVGAAPVVVEGFHDTSRKSMDEAVRPVDSKLETLSGKIQDLSNKVDRMNLDIQNLFNTLRDFKNSGEVSLRDVAQKLTTSNEKLDKAHETIKSKTSSGHYAFYTVCFLLGAILAYVASVIYRSREKPKYI